MEKILISVARQIERLQAEIPNAEKRAKVATAAAGAETQVRPMLQTMAILYMEKVYMQVFAACIRIDSLFVLPTSFGLQDASKILSHCPSVQSALKANKVLILGEACVLNNASLVEAKREANAKLEEVKRQMEEENRRWEEKFMMMLTTQGQQSSTNNQFTLDQIVGGNS